MYASKLNGIFWTQPTPANMKSDNDSEGGGGGKCL